MDERENRSSLPAAAPQVHLEQQKAVITPDQTGALLRLADSMIDEWASNGGDSSLFDTLEALELIVPVLGGFDPEKHEGPFTDFLEPGDDYYTAAPWLAAAISFENKQAADVDGQCQVRRPSSAEPVPSSPSQAAVLGLVEALEEYLQHDGGPGSRDYHAFKSYDARERLVAWLSRYRATPKE